MIAIPSTVREHVDARDGGSDPVPAVIAEVPANGTIMLSRPVPAMRRTSRRTDAMDALPII